MPAPRVLVSLVALALYWGVLVGLVRADAAGPAEVDLDLPGGLPATMTLPWSSGDGPDEVLPRDERPPGVVLAHGFASDRALMSPLARSLARAGYAVLSVDLRGHGANRSPMARGRDQVDHGLLADLGTAVDFLRASSWVDGSRIAVMGHSMGAGASLEYASSDTGIDAVVMISGGWRLPGPHRPPNALFIYAERDPEGIRAASARLAARLAEPGAAAPGRVHGDFARGTAVAQVEVPGTDHLTIVWSDDATREIVHWLDRSFGRSETRTAPAGRDDPRLRLAGIGFVLFVLILPGLGGVLGRVAGPAPADAERLPGPGVGLGLLALALVAAMPLVGIGSSWALLSLDVADVLVPLLGYAGALLVGGLLWTGRLAVSDLRVSWRVAAAALVGIVALHALLAPLGVVFHRLSLTPERTLAAGLAFVGLVPFTLSFHLLLRRGSSARAALASLLGRAVVVVALIAGVALGIVPFVVTVMLPSIVVLFVLFEVLAASVYATSRHRVAIALLEAAWFAWVMAAVNPIRV